MVSAEIIHQSDLIAASKRGGTNLERAFVAKLDPDGIAVVSVAFLHNDGPDYKVVALCKVRDSADPVEVIFTVGSLKIIQRVSIDIEDGSWEPLMN